MLTLKGRLLISGDGAVPQVDPVIIIRDSVISVIASRGNGDLPYEEGGEVVDIPDGTIMPGLINPHVHLSFSGSDEALRDVLEDSDEMLILRATRNAQLALASGTTTLRDCGARGYVILPLRDAINQNIIAGPRILACGMPITTTGGHLHWCGLRADTPDEVRKATRKLSEEGVDFIKIMGSGGFMTLGSNPAVPQYSTEELKIIVTESHRLGRRTAIHALATDSIRFAVDAGVDTLEHCAWLSDMRLTRSFDEEVARGMMRKKLFASVTLGQPHEVLVSLIQGSEIPRCFLQSHQVFLEEMGLARRMLEMGVPTVFNNDAGCRLNRFDDYPLIIELATRIFGLTPLEAITIATGRAAEALGLLQVGTIRPGQTADILITRGNPLLDMNVLRHPHMVIRNGQVLAIDGKLIQGTTSN